jgi:hypothetical protein
MRLELCAHTAGYIPTVVAQTRRPSTRAEAASLSCLQPSTHVLSTPVRPPSPKLRKAEKAANGRASLCDRKREEKEEKKRAWRGISRDNNVCLLSRGQFFILRGLVHEALKRQPSMTTLVAIRQPPLEVSMSNKPDRRPGKRLAGEYFRKMLVLRGEMNL